MSKANPSIEGKEAQQIGNVRSLKGVRSSCSLSPSYSTSSLRKYLVARDYDALKDDKKDEYK
jgi:hypothetical protein